MAYIEREFYVVPLIKEIKLKLIIIIIVILLFVQQMR